MTTLCAEPLSRKKLSEQVYELLKRDIVQCRLEPGQLIEEAMISERYEIGRTPFREACQKLEAEGLVEISPRRGSFVSQFSYASVNNLFEVRMILEPAIAELACKRSSGRPLEALEEITTESEGLKQTEIVGITSNSKRFHVEVAQLTGNRELVSTIDNIHDKLMRILIFAARRSVGTYAFNGIHPKILAAIRSGNLADARKFMREDIQQSWTWVRDFGGTYRPAELSLGPRP
jgi:DNA-binding GntR family transcriptional regulator